MGVARLSEDCEGGDDHGIDCKHSEIQSLKGPDELTAALSWEDFVISSTLSYPSNGNKIGWCLADWSPADFYKGYEWDEHFMQRFV